MRKRRGGAIRLVMVLSVMTVLLLSATVAFAVAAKFHSAESSVANNGALVVSFDERGVGNENITYELTADAEATYYCINGGGKNPSAANKQDVVGDVTGNATFEPKNGRVVASISAGPISSGDFSCPPGQRLRLGAVSYTNIVLTDTTNNTSVTVDDVSRTFFTP